MIEEGRVIAEEPPALKMHDDEIEELLLGHGSWNGREVGLGLEDAREFGTAMRFSPEIAVLLGERQEVTELARACFAGERSSGHERAENNAKGLGQVAPILFQPRRVIRHSSCIARRAGQAKQPDLKARRECRSGPARAGALGC